MHRLKLNETDRWRTLHDAVWAPIPWMLEAVFMLLFALGDYAGMTTVAVLLGFNVLLGLNGTSGAVRGARAAAPRRRLR